MHTDGSFYNRVFKPGMKPAGGSFWRLRKAGKIRGGEKEKTTHMCGTVKITTRGKGRGHIESKVGGKSSRKKAG